ncbi:uncharacterized protein LY89DRAFT_689692 [Mollisia scopiformis]|uniref:DUF5672 domain-containing protein n=1 Tax=Mollisia scopiformis TaxID=149040 RepID=A0A132BDX8_MOLSC|nr:uncharacterized protein LY89DRAFT_689692 [Mollisia scopiformis]KUJ10453.1 hypothetical protein LY89DRAFT_689692 [Mollisia scopiformis]
MERLLASIKSRPIWRIGTLTLAFCIATWFLISLNPRNVLAEEKTNILPDTTSSANTYGLIRNKVAVISDTKYTTNLIPLILHYHSILGPSWPIIFYTTPTTLPSSLSAPFALAIAEKRIQIRYIPDEFNLTSRNGVNLYLSRSWLWEQLAPATHVLIFQADAVLCGNAHKTVDQYVDEGWDWIAAPLHGSEHLYNGGLSLRNRSMILDILSNPENNWEEETRSGKWTMGGEDVWFSRKMDLRGAKLPSFREAVAFACQHDWHTSVEKEPLGYHKVHKNIGKEGLREIERWCPEIGLARPGMLEPST